MNGVLWTGEVAFGGGCMRAAAVVLYCFKVLIVGRYADLLHVCGLQIGLNCPMALRHVRIISDDSDKSIALHENPAGMLEPYEYRLPRSKKKNCSHGYPSRKQ